MAHFGQDHWTEKSQLDKQHARARRRTRRLFKRQQRRKVSEAVKSGKYESLPTVKQDDYLTH